MLEDLKDKTVLYIDDESVNATLFEAQFKKYFHVLTATSVHDGLNIIDTNKIDLIISDFRMPVMNGVDFIKEIKKQNPETKCIIISGYFESQVISEKDRHLIDDYIMKPWNKDKVLEAIARVLI